MNIPIMTLEKYFKLSEIILDAFEKVVEVVSAPEDECEDVGRMTLSLEEYNFASA